MASVEERIQSWLDGPYDPEMKAEIRRLKEVDPQALNDAFYKDLSFGTGGMRGLMGVGTNRLNIYTIRKATQGLANVINDLPDDHEHSVFIGYDVRNQSREFAVEAAKVLSGNGIKALLSKEICPTPLTSFACRYYKCSAAIMITASHNPPEYNGYKVFWEDGCQIVPPHDEEIMEEVAKIKDLNQMKVGRDFTEVGSELDAAYLEELKKIQLLPNLAKNPLKIVYTSLHGTGIRLVPKGLKTWGYTQVSLVEKQSSLDGNFTYAGSPNPENDQALVMGQEQMQKEGADILIATDPDADRIAVATPLGRLTGNEMACICLDHLCKTLLKKKEFPENGAAIKSIVTTELYRKIAENYQIKCIDVLTGFKYIGELIGIWEKTFDAYQYLFGAEESYGFLYGTFVRDKDAVSASCLIAEAAASLKKQNLTLIDRLYEIFRQFGIHKTSLKSLKFSDSKEGMDEMESLMKRLRENPPKKIGSLEVSLSEDYLNGNKNLPPSDVLRYWLDDESKLVIRPSGTEPKIKIYSEVVQIPGKDLKADITACESKAKKLIELFEDEVGVSQESS